MRHPRFCSHGHRCDCKQISSASAPVTKTEQILCRMLGSATPIGAATICIYNELLPSKFTGDLKARSEDDAS